VVGGSAIRKQFDVYDFETVSIMPSDAYGSIGQCELCEGKQVDDMGSRGKLSNHVWGFANRGAKEVAKTHPKNSLPAVPTSSRIIRLPDSEHAIKRLEKNYEELLAHR